MTDKQPEAQRLADDLEILEDTIGDGICKEAAAELRRLYASEASLRDQNTELDRKLAEQEAVMQQALEALEYPGPSWPEARQKAASALRERLAQPYCDDCGGTDPECPLAQPNTKANSEAIPKQISEPEQELGFAESLAHLALPRREWVGLTDEEIKALPQWYPSHEAAAVMPLIRAIEAKLKEKNA